MNQDDIIKMAKEYADEVTNGYGFVTYEFDLYGLEKFALLIRAAERERIKWDTIHSCHSECDKPVCVAMRKAVAEEREACAVIAFNAKTYLEAAAAIRARGQK